MEAEKDTSETAVGQLTGAKPPQVHAEAKVAKNSFYFGGLAGELKVHFELRTRDIESGEFDSFTLEKIERLERKLAQEQARRAALEAQLERAKNPPLIG